MNCSFWGARLIEENRRKVGRGVGEGEQRMKGWREERMAGEKR